MLNLFFYGHTHRLAVEYVDGTLFLNPGSVWFPRGEYQKLGGTYAIVSVNESKIKVTYYTREGLAPVSELQFEYQR
nr:metallophosphoesterase family protein [Ligilactobacillus salivarius]